MYFSKLLKLVQSQNSNDALTAKIARVIGRSLMLDPTHCGAALTHFPDCPPLLFALDSLFARWRDDASALVSD